MQVCVCVYVYLCVQPFALASGVFQIFKICFSSASLSQILFCAICTGANRNAAKQGSHLQGDNKAMSLVIPTSLLLIVTF